jgi:hypothetical protein
MCETIIMNQTGKIIGKGKSTQFRSSIRNASRQAKIPAGKKNNHFRVVTTTIIVEENRQK